MYMHKAYEMFLVCVLVSPWERVCLQCYPIPPISAIGTIMRLNISGANVGTGGDVLKCLLCMHTRGGFSH